MICAATAQGRADAPKALPADASIIFLHHSTGECIWNGGVPAWFQAHNAANRTRYTIVEQAFPKESPYGWENYPYDYWNIWVRNAGPRPFQQEPTLEMLAGRYQVIVLKHCFPVSNIEADTGRGDVASREKRIENYKLQYAALKQKMRGLPNVRFLLWTGAAQVRNDIDEASARRARAFFEWVRQDWDEKGDNIYLWDFYELETEGGLYVKPAYAAGDAHPNETFSKKVAPLLCRRIVAVIEGRGDTASLTGQDGPVPTTAPATTPPPPDRPTTPQTPTPIPPPPTTMPAGPAGAWVFDNAEGKSAENRLWPAAARYATDGGGRVIRFDFSAGLAEDWGEYGRQRIVQTRSPAKNYDVSGYRYLTFRVKADQEMEVVLGLLTLPDPQGPPHQSHFRFSAYLHPPAGRWKDVALDLTKLELGAEGEEAYERAGKPSRPMHLTALRFVTNEKNQKAAFLLDDVTFHRDLPESLKAALQAP